jgi:hypothetical protein
MGAEIGSAASSSECSEGKEKARREGEIRNYNYSDDVTWFLQWPWFETLLHWRWITAASKR